MNFKFRCWQLNTAKEAPRGREVNPPKVPAIDELIGLASYRGLSATVESEINRSKRSGRVFALLVFGLNELGQVNDRHGDPAGDRALCRLAHIFRLSCRILDTAARYGDDKMALILPESGADAAEKVERRICGRLLLDREEPLLSVSVGIAVYPNDGNTLDALFQAAVLSLDKAQERAGDVVTHSGFSPAVISKQKRVLVRTEVDSLVFSKVERMAE